MYFKQQQKVESILHPTLTLTHRKMFCWYPHNVSCSSSQVTSTDRRDGLRWPVFLDHSYKTGKILTWLWWAQIASRQEGLWKPLTTLKAFLQQDRIKTLIKINLEILKINTDRASSSSHSSVLTQACDRSGLKWPDTRGSMAKYSPSCPTMCSFLTHPAL